MKEKRPYLIYCKPLAKTPTHDIFLNNKNIFYHHMSSCQEILCFTHNECPPLTTPNRPLCKFILHLQGLIITILTLALTKELILPFFKSDQKLWDTTREKLGYALDKIFKDDLTAQELYPKHSRMLHDFKQRSLNANSNEDGFFIIYFKAFLSELRSYDLNKVQLRDAIIRFAELPDVNRALVNLKIDITRHINDVVICMNEGNSGASKLFSSTPSNALEDTMPENLESYDLFAFTSPDISMEDKSPDALKIADLLASTSPNIFVQDINPEDIERPSLPAYNPLIIHTDDINIVNENIREWVYDRFSPVDERILSTDDRRTRRMDSLARLLSLNASLSACTAVTFDLSNIPKIVIGANVGDQEEQMTVVTLTESRLAIIREFLTDSLKHHQPEHYQDRLSITACLDALSQKLVSQLPANGHPQEVLIQAARKIINAILFDKQTFSDKEKSLFSKNTPAKILTPQIIDDKARINIYDVMNKATDAIPLENLKKSTGIKNIHAEQLIAYYLFVSLKIQMSPDIKFPLALGISKLCCLTCFNHLKAYTELGFLIVRGHHGQIYLGVVDIGTGEASKQFSTRRATTYAWPSPTHSPDKTLKRKDSASSSPGKSTLLSPNKDSHPLSKSPHRLFAAPLFPSERPTKIDEEKNPDKNDFIEDAFTSECQIHDKKPRYDK